MLLADRIWLTRATVCRRSIAVVVAASAWPALAAAEPGADAHNAPSVSDAPSRPASLPKAARLELTYPLASPGQTDATTLNLDLAAHGIATDTQRASRQEQPFRDDWGYRGSLRAPRLSSLWLWPAGLSGPTMLTPKRTLPLRQQDTRSGWARWNSSMWGVSATVGGLMFTMVGVLSLLPKDFTSWNKPTFFGLKRTFTSGPSFDYDNVFFNYIAHPYDGSEFYLIARNRGLTWWESFAYGVAVSTTFEVLIESAYEGASWQDLWITPVSGAVIGELRWQAKKALEDPASGKPVGTVNKILYVVVDPLDAILNL